MAKESGSRILESVDRKSRDLVRRLQKLQEIGVVLSQEKDLVKQGGALAARKPPSR